MKKTLLIFVSIFFIACGGGSGGNSPTPKLLDLNISFDDNLNLQYYGTPTEINGKDKKAISFDGVDDRVEYSQATYYKNQFTIMFWFKLNENSGNGFRYIYSHGFFNAKDSINIVLNENNQLSLGGANTLKSVINDMDTEALDVNVKNFVDDIWHLYTLTYDGNEAKVYIDGCEKNSLKINLPEIKPQNNLTIGGRSYESENRYYRGALDEVRVFSKALSFSEIKDIAKIDRVFIDLNNFADKTVIQRKNSKANLNLSGCYNGDASTIEARILDENNNEFMPWQTIDSNPQNGKYYGTINDITQGGWYRVETKFNNTKSNLSERFGVGLVIGTIGQSNMDNFFLTTDKSLKVTDYVTRYSARLAGYYEFVGNGSIVLANLLYNYFRVPITLIDGAIAGTSIETWADKNNDNWIQFEESVKDLSSDMELVLWHQGASDTTKSDWSKDVYKYFLNEVYENSKSISREDLKFFTYIQNRGDYKDDISRDEGYQNIRTAQFEYPNETTNVFHGGSTIDMKLYDIGHFYPADYEQMAHRIMQSIKFAYGDSDFSAKGAEISEAIWNNSNEIEIKIKHNGGSDLYIPNPEHLVGFEVSEGDFSEKIEIVDYKLSSDSVTLILEKTPIIAPKVRYLYGMNPLGDASDSNRYLDNILYDNTGVGGIGLPLNHTLQPLQSKVK